MRQITEALAAQSPSGELNQDVYREVCRIVVQEVRNLTGASSAAVCLLTQDKDMLDFVAAAGGSADDITGLRIRVSDSLSDTVVSTGKPLIIDGRKSAATGNLFSELPDHMFSLQGQAVVHDRQQQTAGTDNRMDKGSGGARTALIAPIFENGSLIGTISGMNKMSSHRDGTAEPFDAEDLEILEMLAESVGVAGKINQTFGKAREQARELAAMYDAAHRM